MAKAKITEHYVNNKEFTQAVVEYAETAAAAREAGQEEPQISEYIGLCFMKICEGLSRKPNFIRYSYRDEMVMDGVKDCVKACSNFDLTKFTRSGIPNAFGYFTQCAFYAFLRRIAKEKKQWEIKLKYMENSDCAQFADFGDDTGNIASTMIGKVQGRTESLRHSDDFFIEDNSHEVVRPKKVINRGWSTKKAKKITTATLFE
jgi:hypothetical protein